MNKETFNRILDLSGQKMLTEEKHNRFVESAEYKIVINDDLGEYRIKDNGTTLYLEEMKYFLSFNVNGEWHGTYDPGDLENPPEYPEFEIDSIDYLKGLLTGYVLDEDGERVSDEVIEIELEESEYKELVDKWADEHHSEISNGNVEDSGYDDSDDRTYTTKDEQDFDDKNYL